MTAVDYDNDGFYDLFVPTASRRGCCAIAATARSRTSRRRRTLGARRRQRRRVRRLRQRRQQGRLHQPTYSPNQLFHNNGDGTFTDVTALRASAPIAARRRVVADYNNDGLLISTSAAISIHVRRSDHVLCEERRTNQLYKNNGDARSQTSRSRRASRTGLCLGSVLVIRRRRVSGSVCRNDFAARRSITTSERDRSPMSPSRAARWRTAPA